MNAVVDPFALLPKTYFRTIVIDPPWKFSGGTKGRPQHYLRMADEAIAALPILALCHPDGCHIFVWITSPKMPHALKIAKAWKVRYSARAFVWVKTHAAFGYAAEPLFLPRNCWHTGTGFTTRKNAEDCLLFKTGKPKRLSSSIHELIVAPVREHSRKPDEAYERIEAYCDGPRLELFARQSRPGWSSWGLEATKFDEPMAALEDEVMA